MKIVPFSTEATELAMEIIHAGGVIAHATETCYGLACDLTNPAAVAKLFRIKKRDPSQPVSGLFMDIEEAKRFTMWNDQAEELAGKHLPGPLTIILPLKEHPELELFPTPHGGTTLGIRISSHPHAQAMCDAAGLPLTTTSANRHGDSNPYSPDDIVKSLGEDTELDLILDSGELPHVPPSTVINLATQGTVLREGNIRVS